MALCWIWDREGSELLLAGIVEMGYMQRSTYSGGTRFLDALGGILTMAFMIAKNRPPYRCIYRQIVHSLWVRTDVSTSSTINVTYLILHFGRLARKASSI
jgi:hypothetical protein